MTAQSYGTDLSLSGLGGYGTDFFEFTVLGDLGSVDYSDGAYSSLDSIELPARFETDFFDGELLSADLRTDSLLESEIRSGESSSAVFLNSIEIDLVFGCGANSGFEWSSYTEIDSIFFDGASSDTELSLFRTFVLESFDGEASSITIRTEDTLDLIGYSGESSYYELLSNPAAELSATFLSGESSDSVLTTSVVLDLGIYEGAYSDFDLLLNLPAQLISNTYDGSSASAILSTEFALSISTYSGEHSFFDIEYHPQSFLEPVGYSGEYASLGLRTDTGFIPKKNSAGENLLVGFTHATFALIESNARDGARLLPFVLFTPVVFQPRGYDGSQSSFVLTEAEKWRIWSGESASLDISISDILVPKPISSGETATTGFVNSQSGLFSGSITARDGAYSFWDDYFVTFACVFLNDHYFQTEFYSTTHFELPICCPISRGLVYELDIEYPNGTEPHVTYSKEAIFLEFGLSTDIRIGHSFNSGESSSVSLFDNFVFLDFQSTDGNRSQSNLFDTLNQDVRLCSGYFIPIGYRLNIELNEIIYEGCYSDFVYSGEVLRTNFLTQPLLSVTMADGSAVLHIRFDTELPWEFRAADGAYSMCQFPPESKAHSGEYSRFEMARESASATDGATLGCTMNTYIGVRFLERDCLPNEYIEILPDGNTRMGRFNPVGVEGEPYRHDIRAECFTPRPNDVLRVFPKLRFRFDDGALSPPVPVHTGFTHLEFFDGSQTESELE